ncbi:hypothetical protein ACS0TY_014852 [Phlomoides rotata]
MRGTLHGTTICRGAPPVSHLFFADDSIIFGRANKREVSRLKSILNVYEKASGQVVNLGKSDICFSGGVPSARQDVLASLLGVNRVDQHQVYLGILTHMGRSKTAVFNSLAVRVEKKIKDWKERTMSQAGKLTLLKSVIQSMPTYLMLVFKLPYGIVDRIEAAMAQNFSRLVARLVKILHDYILRIYNTSTIDLNPKIEENPKSNLHIQETHSEFTDLQYRHRKPKIPPSGLGGVALGEGGGVAARGKGVASRPGGKGRRRGQGRRDEGHRHDLLVFFYRNNDD